MLRGSPGSRALAPIACLAATVLSFGTVTAAVGFAPSPIATFVPKHSDCTHGLALSERHAIIVEESRQCETAGGARLSGFG